MAKFLNNVATYQELKISGYKYNHTECYFPPEGRGGN